MSLLSSFAREVANNDLEALNHHDTSLHGKPIPDTLSGPTVAAIIAAGKYCLHESIVHVLDDRNVILTVSGVRARTVCPAPAAFAESFDEIHAACDTANALFKEHGCSARLTLRFDEDSSEPMLIVENPVGYEISSRLAARLGVGSFDAVSGSERLRLWSMDVAAHFEEAVRDPALASTLTTAVLSGYPDVTSTQLLRSIPAHVVLRDGDSEVTERLMPSIDSVRVKRLAEAILAELELVPIPELPRETPRHGGSVGDA